MKPYLLLMGIPVLLRYAYRVVKFLWPLIIYAAKKWFSRHSKSVTKQQSFTNKGEIMAEQYGVENIKKIFNVGITLGEAAEANVPAWKDGKTDAADFGFVPRMLPAIGDLVSLQYTQVVPEVKDISSNEVQELYVFFKEHYDSPNKTVEEIVETGLGAVIQIVATIQNLITLVKAIKNPTV